MKEAYERMYKIYYDVATQYTEDDLTVRIKRINRFRDGLCGMVELLESVKEFSSEEAEKERERIINTFSSIKMLNAYMNDGEVYVFAEHYRNS